MKTALLLSGGMDSTAIAYWKRPEIAVTVDYGQRPADAEIRAASAVSDALRIEHVVLRLPCLGVLGSGDLTDRPPAAVAPKAEWWPYRNQLLVTVAAASLLPEGVARLWIGTLRTDGHHADGRPAFVEGLSRLLALQEGGMTVESPAIGLDGAELVRLSGIPAEILAWSHSCHRSNFACGECGGCRKHYLTMTALGEPSY